MKIENRSKSIIRFKTTVGNITLNPNLNDLTQIQYDTIKKHPMFEPMVKSSVLVVKEETETDQLYYSETEDTVKPFPLSYS